MFTLNNSENLLFNIFTRFLKMHKIQKKIRKVITVIYVYSDVHCPINVHSSVRSIESIKKRT